MSTLDPAIYISLPLLPPILFVLAGGFFNLICNASTFNHDLTRSYLSVVNYWQPRKDSIPLSTMDVLLWTFCFPWRHHTHTTYTHTTHRPCTHPPLTHMYTSLHPSHHTCLRDETFRMTFPSFTPERLFHTS